MKKIMKITGMECEHCQKRVEEALKKLNCQAIQVDLANQEATFEAPSNLNDETLQEKISNLGYDVLTITTK